VPARVKLEGRTFWANHDRDLERRARSAAITEAVASGSSARLARVLAAMPRKEAQALLDVQVPRWHEPATIARMYKLAAELLRWKPPWMLGAILATGAVLALQRDAKTARAVLAWVKPHVRRVEHLAGQIGIFADRFVETDVEAAAALFDLVIATGKLRLPQYGNALYSVLSANRTKPAERTLQQRVLRAALMHAGDDASVRFNAACLAMELGKPKAALEHLLLALQLGTPLEHAQQEPLLRELMTDPRIARVRVRPKQRRPGFVTHGPPRRG
jgi:hypothetical protein